MENGWRGRTLAARAFSSCSIITSPIWIMPMRRDRVVPLRVYPATLQAHVRPLLRRYLPLGRVDLLVQPGLAMQPRFRPRPADILHDRLVTDQRLSGPVAADRAKQPVFDQVPL